MKALAGLGTKPAVAAHPRTNVFVRTALFLQTLLFRLSLAFSSPTQNKWHKSNLIDITGFKYGGESGIRTHVRVSPKHAFQACAFSHSAISPALWEADSILGVRHCLLQLGLTESQNPRPVSHRTRDKDGAPRFRRR